MQKEKKDKHFIKKPVYPGGQDAMRKFIKKNLKYPKEALENRIEGTVSLKYTIDYKGNVIDTKIVSGIGHGCDEEAERLAKLLKFEVPKTRKLRVTFHKDLHVHFRLPKQQEKTPPKYKYELTSTTKKAGKPTSSFSYTVSITKGKK